MGKKIQWHPGFVAAMNLELTANHGELVFEKEHNLNTKPLEIDLLIIKKEAQVSVQNEIGRLFRGHNIVEYKSPDDHFDIDTFYKAQSYAGLYKAYGKTVDAIKADDVTVSMIREAKPEKLFCYLKEQDMRVENPYQGIYYIDGVMFPTQIIVTEELEPETHIWLRSLSRKLKEKDVEQLVKNVNQLTTKFDKEMADSVLEVSVKANRKLVEDLRGVSTMCKALLEIMEPEINEIKKQVEQESRAAGIRETRRAVKEAVKATIKESVVAIIDTCREFGLSEEATALKIENTFTLTEAETREYMARYWK